MFMGNFLRRGLAVAIWATLWYPLFGIGFSLWMSYRVVEAGIPDACQRLILVLLFLFLPLAGRAQAAWFCDAWDVWNHAVRGSVRAFAVYVASALIPAVLAGWWLVLRTK
ncbi:MAG: hypothetical protein AB1816_05145 [Bacillota bacterium]